MSEFVQVAKASSIPDPGRVTLEINDRFVVLLHVGGEFFCIDDVCTHEYALLSQGFMEDGAIECPLHQARFDIVTGRCMSAPATVDLKRYQVRIEEDDVYVHVKPIT